MSLANGDSRPSTRSVARLSVRLAEDFIAALHGTQVLDVVVKTCRALSLGIEQALQPDGR